MATGRKTQRQASRDRRVAEAIEVLHALQFGLRQRNEVAALTLLYLIDLGPDSAWAEAQAPLRGITPIIGFYRGRVRSSVRS